MTTKKQQQPRRYYYNAEKVVVLLSCVVSLFWIVSTTIITGDNAYSYPNYATLFVTSFVVRSSFHHNSLGYSQKNNVPFLCQKSSSSLLFSSSTESPVDAKDQQEPQSSSSTIPVGTRREKQKVYTYNQQELMNIQKNRFPRTWVPLGSIDELNPVRPTELSFLGLSYVAYKKHSHANSNNSNDWIVVDNICPHRLAPLSEGRIDSQYQINATNDNGDVTATTTTTVLQCSYHGWTFNDEGKCVKIPQADSRTERAAMQNSNCHIQPYSVQVVKNILWVWVWPEDIIELSTRYYATLFGTTSTTPANTDIIDGLLGDPNWMLRGVLANCSTFTRELPYGWDTLLENILDPAHVPFAHHGLQGTRDDAIPITMSTSPISLFSNQLKQLPKLDNESHLQTNNEEIIDNYTNQIGFEFTINDRTMKMKRSTYGIFRAPYVVKYDGEYENILDRTFNLTTIMIPTKPGWSQIMIIAGQNDNSGATDDFGVKKVETKKKKKKLITTIFGLIPKWVVHILSNRFLDSDLAFLHYQEQQRNKRKNLLIRQQQQNNEHDDKEVLGDDGVIQDMAISTIRQDKSISINSIYFMPTQSDRSTTALRRWIRDYASYVTEEEVLPPPIYDRTILFNRYVQHSDKCKHCNEVYNKIIPKWRKNSYIVLCFSILVLSIRSVLPTKIESILSLLGGISAVCSIIVLRLLVLAENSMTRGEFNHYENH